MEHDVTSPTAKKSKLQQILLYILIGGLVASALVAVTAILIGEFNDVTRGALSTIFAFVVHSLLVLWLVSADTHNRIGQDLMPTTLVAVVFASLLTTTLGNWNIIDEEMTLRAGLLYSLLIGWSFIVTGALALRTHHMAVRGLIISGVALLSVWVLALVPWVLAFVERFDPLYYRAISALTVLTTTIFLVAIIMRAVTAGTKPKNIPEKATKAKPTVSTHMIVIYVLVGSLVSLVWLGGMIAFVIDGVR